MPGVKNVLIPTDLSKLSMSAMPFALDRAEKYDAVIHILHVIDTYTPILTIRTVELTQESINEALFENAKKNLEALLEEHAPNAPVKIVTAIKKGVTHEEIIKYANENNIDLITLATHGRTGLLHTLIGSVAEKVIRYAKCPVLVIKPQESK